MNAYPLRFPLLPIQITIRIFHQFFLGFYQSTNFAASMSTFGTAATSNYNPNRSAEVRCWEVTRSGTNISTVPKAAMLHDQPVLCSAWKDDGTAVFSGGCDKQAKMWPLLSGGQPVQVAMHDAPIKEIAWVPEINLLVTGSLDKTLRQPNPAHVQQIPERCYALSVRHPLMVVGTADRNLVVYNLQNPQTEFKRITSPLKHQTRCLAAFPEQQGFLAMMRCSQPIPCCAFNYDGSISAYSVCYDWSKGAENHNPATARTYMLLHSVQENEIKGKPRTSTGRK
ncbi:hypothetical protein ACH5RR_022464 [Cinchona calisaya]|uniref:Uncharacterized protein n=1 Tax=Cinchona calisaya TaxID=153742 RepID=A0ABD2Z7W2_9GENT